MVAVEEIQVRKNFPGGITMLQHSGASVFILKRIVLKNKLKIPCF